MLVERTRERGIGDLLFMTGPLAFLQHLHNHSIEIDLMAFADRVVALTHSPMQHGGCVRCGPLEYDHLRLYNTHWLVNAVTEHDCELDQLNVYDALFQQLGYKPEDIDARWKRPSATLVPDDFQNLERLFHHVWTVNKIDLRHTGYYVVAPFVNATLRSAPYATWLNIIQQLATKRPVVVVGNSSLRLPDMDMSAGQFNQSVAALGGAVFNAVDCTTIRVLMALIARSTALIGLDSAPLYMAQALNIPAVSLWGTHAPHARIGYDKNYMDLAIWPQPACKQAPCFAYGNFPINKCPQGIRQTCCEVIGSITPEDVLKKIEMVESAKKFPVLPAVK